MRKSLRRSIFIRLIHQGTIYLTTRSSSRQIAPLSGGVSANRTFLNFIFFIFKTHVRRAAVVFDSVASVGALAALMGSCQL